MNLKSVKNADVKNKTVMLRADLDVPIQSSQIADDTRLRAWFPTLNYLLEEGATIIIVGHLGRPSPRITNHESRIKNYDKEFSLRPVALWIKDKLRSQNEPKETKVGEFEGWEITDKIFLLENIRFYPEEEKNDPQFAKRLAQIAQVYVNDAFASSHRAHVSIVGITKFLPSFAGLRLLEEVKVLSGVLENPKRPLGVVIGGAKIETKLPLVEEMHGFADYILVGGEIVENDKVLLKIAHEKVHSQSVLLMADTIENKQDITLRSVENFLQVLKNVQTIVWNGPLGQIEVEEYQKGTQILAEGILKIPAFTIVGGGDTIGFLKKKNLLKSFSFVSTGGGAMLEFLAGEKLPGIVVLEQK
ncbi:MAG TPA: phosphoglycerate kinase [Patescibacteria group bacterium]|jgi:phosphoglycerate kinase|nr:phosphoglycerate kinase [Patescibacteria group bacterium]